MRSKLVRCIFVLGEFETRWESMNFVTLFNCKILDSTMTTIWFITVKGTIFSSEFILEFGWLRLRHHSNRYRNKITKDRLIDLALLFLLQHYGKSFVDGRKNIKQQDLTSYVNIGFVKAHEKLWNILLLMKFNNNFYSTTRTCW